MFILCIYFRWENLIIIHADVQTHMFSGLVKKTLNLSTIWEEESAASTEYSNCACTHTCTIRSNRVVVNEKLLQPVVGQWGMAGFSSLWEPKLCFSGEQDPAVTFQWFSSCVSAYWFHPVRADGRRSVGCESPAAPGADWTGVSAKSQVFYFSLCPPAFLPLLSVSLWKCYSVMEKTTDFFSVAQLGLVSVVLFLQSSTFTLYCTVPFAWAQSIIWSETSI